MIEYNGNSDFNSNNNAQIINISLPYNKLIVWLWANDFMTFIKKKYVFKTKDEADELSKVQAV